MVSGGRFASVRHRTGHFSPGKPHKHPVSPSAHLKPPPKISSAYVAAFISGDFDEALLPRPVRTLYLFSVKRGGRPYNYHTVKDTWNAAVEKSGVKDAHLHDLRAKSLTDAKKQGLDPVALAGHADARMTARYIRQHDTVVAVPPKMGEF